METNKNKQFISTKVCIVLSSVMNSHAVQLHHTHSSSSFSLLPDLTFFWPCLPLSAQANNLSVLSILNSALSSCKQSIGHHYAGSASSIAVNLCPPSTNLATPLAQDSPSLNRTTGLPSHCMHSSQKQRACHASVPNPSVALVLVPSI